jgi:hypothetical protein
MTAPGKGHRFDDDCNWRSAAERDAHKLMTKGIHNELVTCEHRALGHMCEDLATAALDALYENGMEPRHA